MVVGAANFAESDQSFFWPGGTVTTVSAVPTTVACVVVKKTVTVYLAVSVPVFAAVPDAPHPSAVALHELSVTCLRLATTFGTLVGTDVAPMTVLGGVPVLWADPVGLVAVGRGELAPEVLCVSWGLGLLAPEQAVRVSTTDTMSAARWAGRSR